MPSALIRLIVLFCGVMTARPCLSQQADPDPLFLAWKDEDRHDTVRLNALHKFLWAGFMHQHPDSAFRLNEERLVMARAKGYRQPEAEAYNLRGYIHSTRGDHAKAIADYTDCLRIYDQLGRKTGIGAALSGIGGVHYHQGDLPSAMTYFEQGLQVYEEAGNEPGIAVCLNNIGNVHADRGDLEKALACYERVLEIRKAAKDVQRIASTLNNIGLVHADMAVASDREGKSVLAAAQREEAISKLDESITYSRQVGDHQGVCGTLVNIAIIYADEGGREKEVVRFSQLALPIAQEHGFLTETREIHWALYKAYQGMGRHALALDMYQRYILVRDSIRSEDNKQEILRQQMQYDFDKKEAMTKAGHEQASQQAAAELAAEQQRRRNILLASGGVLIIAALLLVLLLNTRRNAARLRLKNAEIMRTQARLVETEKQRENEQVRTRIARNIHDDLGSDLTKLGLLGSRIERAATDPDAVRQLATRVVDLSHAATVALGDIVWAADPHQDTAQGLVARCSTYAHRMLEGTGMEHELRFVHDGPDRTLDPGLKHDVFLLLKEAVHNAVKHAGARRIEVSLATDAMRFSLRVSDDGAGYDPATVKQGNGLRSMQARATRIGAGMTIATAPGAGCTVTVEGPLDPPPAR